MMRFMHRSRGFTLIEIMIVILIIALLLAIAIPNFLRAREVSRARTCQSNLREIMTAKEQWAMENYQGGTATPEASALVSEYIKNSEDDQLPPCPVGGEYTIGDLATQPTCSIGGNADSGDWDDHFLIQ